jgi:diguanylate cyclase (GGDEF)-like protein/PAS domain S-box-containing protein
MKSTEKMRPYLAGGMKTGHIRIYAIILIAVILSLSGFYLRFAWNRYQSIASSEAIQLAQSIESLLHPEHIAELSGSAEDLKKPEYVMTKLSFIRMAETTHTIRFAYLLVERGENLILLLDSETPDSPDYSPPGQVYTEADDICWEPFNLGETVLTKPTTDRWGTWISALVPIKDPDSGSVIAVLGIDYSAAEWNLRIWKQMIPDVVIVACLLMLFISLIHIWIQHFNLKNLNKKLAFEEALYHSVFDQAPIGIAIVNNKNFTHRSEFGDSMNPMFEQILGRTSRELANIQWPEITHSEDLDADVGNFEQFKTGEIIGYSMEKRFIKPDGSIVWVNMIIKALDIDHKKNNHLCLIQDITEQKAMLEEIEKQQGLLLSFFDSSQDLIYLKDDNFRHIIANKALADFHRADVNSIIGKTDNELMDANSAMNCRKTDEEAIKRYVTVNTNETVEGKIYETRKFPVSIGSGKTGVGAYIRDVTVQHRQEEMIRKASDTYRIITECMIKPFVDIQEQLDFALHESIALTGSRYGYIYFYDEVTSEFTLNSWTNGVMADCTIIEKRTKYQLDKTGIWGEVVRQRKPIIVNSFDAPNPLKKGYPEGHVSIHKYMSIPIFENGRIVAVIGAANKETDYTESDIDAMTVLMSGVWVAISKREKEQENEYLAYHDYLTGVFNRRYFDKEFARRNSDDEYPIAIIMGDVNGLKLYNDTYGHLAGDLALKEIANKIRASINSEDILARISGDEFAVIISKTNEEDVRKYMDLLTQTINKKHDHNGGKSLTISCGCGIQRKKEDPLDAVLKEAEAYMYNRKYFDSKSTRSNKVNIILEALFAKSEREKYHSERVSLISEGIAVIMKLDEQLIDRVRTAGLLHDIGKIGIDENILNKNGKLDKNEWEIMKLHSAKGADILGRTVEYKQITDIVLSHHEWYDGTGYPNGLKGETIPLEARIIAIADAYDAMTNERPYRNAISDKAALTEIKKCSGTQFDPKIVKLITGKNSKLAS